MFSTLLHSSFVLLPVLGITWALGFFVIGDNVASEIVEWLFCLMNSIQGLVIFIVHCLMNREVHHCIIGSIVTNKFYINFIRYVEHFSKRVDVTKPPRSKDLFARNCVAPAQSTHSINSTWPSNGHFHSLAGEGLVLEISLHCQLVR